MTIDHTELRNYLDGLVPERPSELQKMDAEVIDVQALKQAGVVGHRRAAREQVNPVRVQPIELPARERPPDDRDERWDRASVHAFQGTRWTVAGEAPVAQGNHHPSIAPYGLFHAADGAIQVCVGSESQWATFAPLVGLDPADPRFATNRDRVAHRAALVADIEAIGRRRKGHRERGLFDHDGQALQLG